MLYTPAALELALLCPLFSSFGGDDDKPETAESTLVRSAVSDDMITFSYQKPLEGVLRYEGFNSWMTER